MFRNAFARAVSAVVLGLITLSCSSESPREAAPVPAPATSSAKTNIILIYAEDITTLIGAYGDKSVKTPNIDQLMREGIRYTHAFQAAGVDSPSRAAMITGMYPTSIGAQHMRTMETEIKGAAATAAKPMPDGLPHYSVVPPPAVKPFPEYLRRAGYYATNNHKTDYQFEAPVTTWDENGPAASYLYRPIGAPFFAVFTLFATHESMLAFAKDPLAVDPARLVVPPILPDIPAIRTDLARQYTNIAIMDRHLGELIETLKRDAVYDSSVIFFMADNGGTVPWFTREVLDRGTRVPLIVRLPRGERGGTTSAEIVSGVDLAPTVLSLAGVPIPAHMQGQAFLGDQRAETPRKYAFSARDRMDAEHDRTRTVRDARYRYVYNYHPEQPWYRPIASRRMLPGMQDILRMRDAGTLPPVTAVWFKTKSQEELYDEDVDPYEMRNLASDARHAAKLAELRSALSEWTKTDGDMGAMPEKNMLRQMWNGGNKPPLTAVPEVRAEADGVRIDCATPGASIGYWIDRAGTPSAPELHAVRSWDYQNLYRELGIGDFPKNGEWVAAPRRWIVYDDGVIPLAKGDTLHVNAMRIGYLASEIAYQDGRTARSVGR